MTFRITDEGLRAIKIERNSRVHTIRNNLRIHLDPNMTEAVARWEARSPSGWRRLEGKD